MMSISAHESKSIVIFKSDEISVASVCMRKPVATFGFISSSSWPNKDPTLFLGIRSGTARVLATKRSSISEATSSTSVVVRAASRGMSFSAAGVAGDVCWDSSSSCRPWIAASISVSAELIVVPLRIAIVSLVLAWLDKFSLELGRGPDSVSPMHHLFSGCGALVVLVELEMVLEVLMKLDVKLICSLLFGKAGKSRLQALEICIERPGGLVESLSGILLLFQGCGIFIADVADEP